MKFFQFYYLIIIVFTITMASCSDDNSPGGSSNNNNNGGGSNTGGCAGGPSTVTDIDGNVYNVLSIGNQCWMKENLKTIHYKNGVAIPTGLSDAQWQNTTSGACADYDNNPANSTVYGKLYNWYAVADPQGLCPTGWHVPSDAEWTTLENYLGGSPVAGGRMKEAGLTHWANPNTGATNSSGFTGLPGGYRFLLGDYSLIGSDGAWWSATQNSAMETYFRGLSYNDGSVNRSNSSKILGFSVRCVRD